MRRRSRPLVVLLALVLFSAFAGRPAAAQCNPGAPPPRIFCPSDFSVAASGDPTNVTFSIGASFSGSCDLKSLEAVPPAGSGFPVGDTTTVTATATDLAGRTATCSFKVTVVRPAAVGAALTESAVSGLPSDANIRTEACRGTLCFFFDTATTNLVRIFDGDTRKGVVATPNFRGLQGAETDTGVVFLGEDIQTRQAQFLKIDVLDLTDNSITTRSSFFSAAVPLAQSVLMKGDSQGNYCGFGGNTAFVHAKNMADGAFSLYTISNSATPRDVVLMPQDPGACALLTTGTGANGVSYLYFDGRPSTFTSSSFAASSFTLAGDGFLYFTDPSNPILYRELFGFEKTLFDGKTQIRLPAGKPLAALFQTPTGHLGGIQAPRDISLLDPTFNLQKNLTLSPIGQILDFRPYAGPPFSLLVNELVSGATAQQGTVRKVTIDIAPSESPLPRDRFFLTWPLFQDPPGTVSGR